MIIILNDIVIVFVGELMRFETDTRVISKLKGKILRGNNLRKKI